MPIDLTGPFRGSDRRRLPACSLRGSATRSPVPAAVPRRVRARAALEVDLALRARAAGLLVAGRGAVAGYAAAELWGASCAPSDAPVHVLLTVPTTAATGCASIATDFDFGRDHVPGIDSGGVLTTPERTCVRPRSLGARSSSERVGRPRRPRALLRRGPGRRPRTAAPLPRRRIGGADIAEALRPRPIADAESPMETRVRVPLVLAGLRRRGAVSRWSLNGRPYRLDLAFPELLIAVEYDGAEHRTAGVGPAATSCARRT